MHTRLYPNNQTNNTDYCRKLRVHDSPESKFRHPVNF